MRLSTAINHKNRLVRILEDIYNSAEIYCLSSDEIIKRKNERIYNDPAYKKVPEWVRSYISGYNECKWQSHWKLVKWVLPFEDVNYDKWNDLPEEGKEHYRQNKGQGKHVYIKDPSKNYT